MSKKIAFLCIAIVCAFIALVFVPKKDFIISIFPLRAGESLLVYDDVTDGGSSKAKMDELDSALAFECTLGADTSKGAWCGLIWSFTSNTDSAQVHYENWILVDSVVINVYAETAGEIIAKVWEFDPDVTNQDSLSTYRQKIKEIPLQKGDNRIAIGFDEFYVPDFWFEQTGASKDKPKDYKDRIARFEITPGWNAPRGVSMRYVFKNICAKGVGSFEFAIFLSICVLIIVIGLGFIKGKK